MNGEINWTKGCIFIKNNIKWVIVATWHKYGELTHYDIQELYKEHSPVYKIDSYKIDSLTVSDFCCFHKKLYL